MDDWKTLEPKVGSQGRLGPFGAMTLDTEMNLKKEHHETLKKVVKLLVKSWSCGSETS